MLSWNRLTTTSTLSLVLGLGTLGVSDCRSAADKANDAALAQAKQQAAATGTAQQVTWTDKDGTQVTTVVQPPAPGSSTQQVTTTRSTVKTADGATTRSTTTTASTTPVAAAAPTIVPAGTVSQPATVDASAAPALAAAPPANGPVISPVEVHVPRGTTLAIRIDQHISVKTSRAGDRFTGEVVTPVAAGDSNRIAIPKGTKVEGHVTQSHRRGHFKGRSYLGLSLTSMELGGQRYALDTTSNVRTKKGKGKRSAAFIGGGTGLGMLVGGIASGGVGLLVGGLAGAGAGTALGGLTGNRDIEIPAESVLNFRLADDLVVQPI